MSVASFVSGISLVKERLPVRGTLRELVSLMLNQACAALLLFAFSPLMLIVAALIWRRDGSPVLFAHYRVGANGKLFRCFKFRSMYLDSERMLKKLLSEDSEAAAQWARDQKLENDPRITPIGAFLRFTSIDELPQLFNVLRGEMNLVGPRPITVEELDRYDKTRWHYLAVRPGITGLWQVSGRNNLSYDERVELDRHYVETHGLRVDLKILLDTIRVVLQREGAR